MPIGVTRSLAWGRRKEIRNLCHNVLGRRETAKSCFTSRKLLSPVVFCDWQDCFCFRRPRWHKYPKGNDEFMTNLQSLEPLTKQKENLSRRWCIETAGTIHFLNTAPIQYSLTKTPRHKWEILKKKVSDNFESRGGIFVRKLRSGACGVVIAQSDKGCSTHLVLPWKTTKHLKTSHFTGYKHYSRKLWSFWTVSS